MKETIIVVCVTLGFLLGVVFGLTNLLCPDFVIRKRNQFNTFFYGDQVKPPPPPVLLRIVGLIATIMCSAVVFSVVRRLLR